METTMIIEKYLDGELVPEELDSFENSLKNDNELSKLVKLHSEVNKSILESDIHNFRDLLRDIYAKFSKTRKFTSKDNNSGKGLAWRKISLAAFLIIIVGLSGTYFFEHRLSSPEELYSRFYSPYQADVSIRSVGQTQNGITLAIQLYQKKDYNTAFEILGNLLNNNKNNPAVRFYYGITAMELNRYETAIYQMNELVKSNQQPFAIHAEWYLGLCYLKLNDETKAQDYFKKIYENNGYYSSRAHDILKKLP
jgi:tetratricopeptide (TPR) repeat protein